MKAEEIWAAAVHEANIWMSSHADRFAAEFGAVIIPKIRDALAKNAEVRDAAAEWQAAWAASESIGAVLDAASEWRAAWRAARIAALAERPGVWDRLARAEHRLSDAVEAIELGERT